MADILYPLLSEDCNAECESYRAGVIYASIRREFPHSRTCSYLLWRRLTRWCWAQSVHRVWPWCATHSVHLLPKRHREGKRARQTTLCFLGTSFRILGRVSVQNDLKILLEFRMILTWLTGTLIQFVCLRDIAFTQANSLANFWSWFCFRVGLRQNGIQISSLLRKNWIFLYKLGGRGRNKCRLFTFEKVFRA